MHIHILELGDRIDNLVTARSLIHPSLLCQEKSLLTKKWFDYRFMSPLEATLHFGDCYRNAYRNHIRTAVDLELADKVQGLQEGLPPSPAGWFTQLWMARQRADEILLPYDEVLEFGFWFAARRKRKTLPRPLQLFANEKTSIAWRAEFAKFEADRAPVIVSRGSELPAYQINIDAGLPAQMDYRGTMIDVISNQHRSWTDVIGYHVLTRRHLPLKTVLGMMPSSVRRPALKEALSLKKLNTWGETTVAKSMKMPLQSCFGMQDEGLPANACLHCPLRTDCALISDVVDTQTERVFGSVSPVVEARRAAGRARVNKFRAKSVSTPPATHSTRAKAYSGPVPF